MCLKLLVLLQAFMLIDWRAITLSEHRRRLEMRDHWSSDVCTGNVVRPSFNEQFHFRVNYDVHLCATEQ
jgi:hypothetical protein